MFTVKILPKKTPLCCACTCGVLVYLWQNQNPKCEPVAQCGASSLLAAPQLHKQQLSLTAAEPACPASLWYAQEWELFVLWQTSLILQAFLSTVSLFKDLKHPWSGKVGSPKMWSSPKVCPPPPQKKGIKKHISNDLPRDPIATIASRQFPDTCFTPLMSQ